MRCEAHGYRGASGPPGILGQIADRAAERIPELGLSSPDAERARGLQRLGRPVGDEVNVRSPKTPMRVADRTVCLEIGRQAHLGWQLQCLKCDRGAARDF